MSQNLSYGSSGDEVKKLQELLNSNGATLDVDGKFGSQTEAAVKNYQKNNGLDVDGIAGANTMTSLRSSGTGGAASSGTITGDGWQGTTIGGSATDTAGTSNVVQQAQQLLNQYKVNGYTSNYSTPISETVQSILNRKPFEYNVEEDPLYQNYRDYYTNQGKLAMEDTMGKAATLTGGYGNSYAQQVGQQTYQSYMDELNGVIPELHQLALDKYNAETDDLYNRYNLLSSLEEQDFDRWYTAQQWQQQYGTALGGTDSGSSSSSGSGSGDGFDGDTDSSGGYNNDGFSDSVIKAMQTSLGVKADGKWGQESKNASGGKTALEAFDAWQNGNLGNEVWTSKEQFDRYIAPSLGLTEKVNQTGGTNAVMPTSSNMTDQFIKYYQQIGGKNADKGVLLSAISDNLSTGKINDEEAAYLMDYYGLWDYVE